MDVLGWQLARQSTSIPSENGQEVQILTPPPRPDLKIRSSGVGVISLNFMKSSRAFVASRVSQLLAAVKCQGLICSWKNPSRKWFIRASNLFLSLFVSQSISA